MFESAKFASTSNIFFDFKLNSYARLIATVLAPVQDPADEIAITRARFSGCINGLSFLINGDLTYPRINVASCGAVDGISCSKSSVLRTVVDEANPIICRKLKESVSNIFVSKSFKSGEYRSSAVLACSF